MYSLITKITHSTVLKDTIAVARGVYRVASANNPPMNPSESDWITKEKTKRSDQLNTQRIQIQHKLKSIQTEKKTVPIVPIEVSTSEFAKETHLKEPITNVQNKIDEPQKTSYYPEQTPSNTAYNQLIQKMKNEGAPQKSQNKESKVISSRFGRIFQYSKLGKWMLETEVEAFVARTTGYGNQKQVYERGAHKITEQLCKMRGAPLKVAQMLSIQEDNLIPAPIRKAFEKAREKAHVMPQSQVEEALTLYLSSDWKQKLKSFEMKPFAAASIGQVHCGVSIEGDELAIKLQYPGVEKSIHSDMKNLKMLLKLPGILPKGIFLDKLLANTENQLRQQCDYQREASMHKLYDQCLKSTMGSEYGKYAVPKIYKELSTRNIMSSQFLKGVGISRFQQGQIPQQVRNQVGRLLMKLTFSEIFEMGIMQSDPNPSNFTYNLQKRQLNLLDFGATHIYDQTFLNSYRGIINASVAENKQDIVKHSILAGFLTNQQNSVMLQNHIQSILTLGEPLRWEGVYDFGNQKITERIYKTIPHMLKNRLKSPPEQIYSLHRKLSGAYLACIRMRAKVDCHRIYAQLRPDYKIKEFV